jgi:hypothetical protein
MSRPSGCCRASACRCCTRPWPRWRGRPAAAEHRNQIVSAAWRGTDAVQPHAGRLLRAAGQLCRQRGADAGRTRRRLHRRRHRAAAGASASSSRAFASASKPRAASRPTCRPSPRHADHRHAGRADRRGAGAGTARPLSPARPAWTAAGSERQQLQVERPLGEPHRRDGGDHQRAAQQHPAAVEPACAAAQRPAAGRPPRWPAGRASTPTLKPTSASTSACPAAGPGRPARWQSRSRAPGRRRRPRQRRPWNSGQTLFSAASTTDAAMADSTSATAARHPQRGQRQRDRVRHGERGDDAQHVPEGRPKRIHRLPAASARPATAADAHRRQQQRQQEQDVVEADPDVPHAFAQVVHELASRRLASASTKACCGACGPRMAVRVRPGLQVEQAAVLRVEVGEQRVVQASAARGAAGQASCSGSTL